VAGRPTAPPELIGVSMIFAWPAEVSPLAQSTLRTPWPPLARPMSAKVSVPFGVTCDQRPGPPVGDAAAALADEAAVNAVPASRAATAAAAVVTLMLSMTVRMEPPGGLQYWRSC
jgi:hypothetical protein